MTAHSPKVVSRQPGWWMHCAGLRAVLSGTGGTIWNTPLTSGYEVVSNNSARSSCWTRRINSIENNVSGQLTVRGELPC